MRNQSGAVSLVIIILIIIGIVVGIFLINSGTNFLPSAQEVIPQAPADVPLNENYISDPSTYVDK